MRRVSPWVVVAIAVPASLALATAWTVSIPGWHFDAFLVVELLWFGVGAGWVAAAVAGLVRRVRGRSLEPRAVGTWVATPFFALVATGIAASDVPLRLRFELSRPAMDRFASDVDPRGGAPDRDRIGLYSVERIDRLPTGVRFLVADSGFLDPCGFAHSRRGEPTAVGEDSYRHLDGPWYIWCESW